MVENASSEGFNKSGFKDIALPDGLNKINDIRIKISQYCPAFNEGSNNNSTAVFSKLVFSMKRPNSEKWDNIDIDLDDLDLFIMRAPGLRAALLKMGGVRNETDGNGET